MKELVIIFLAKYLIFIQIVLLGVYFLFLKKDRKKIFTYTLFVAGIISLLLSLIAGELYYNPRPFVVNGLDPIVSHEANNGFPSHHALLTFTISFVLFLFSKKEFLISLGISVLVSLGRILSLVHHTLDIFGSILISLISVLLTIQIIKRWIRPAAGADPFTTAKV